MKHLFVVELEASEADIALWAAKRKQRHLLKRSFNDHVEILVCDALKSSLIPTVNVKPAPATTFAGSSCDLQVAGDEVV